MDLFAGQSGLRGRKNRFRGDAADATKNGFDGPVIFGVGEENFAGAFCFRPVVPALEQREMALANGGRWRWGRPGHGSSSILCEGGESRFEARFENSARELRCQVSGRCGLCFSGAAFCSLGPLVPWSLLLRNRLDDQRLREKRGRTGLLVLDSHSQGRKTCRSAHAAALKKEDGNFVGVRAGLKNDGAKFAERANELSGERVHGFNALHLNVKLSRGLKGEIGRSLIALSAKRDEPAFATSREK